MDSPDGARSKNDYGLPDTGTQLWAMGSHYQLTHDVRWLRQVAPTMIKMCDWIIAARKSSMAKQARDAPWHELIKYRPYCDEEQPAYSYHTDTYGYWMNCLARDEVKQVLLGFYPSMAYGMSRGRYAGVEVTMLRTGDNYATLPHLDSGTQQLSLLRHMLLREEGEDLWLAQAMPRPWLEGGKEVRVEDAPALFGKTGYVMRSTDGARQITIDLEPPVDKAPRCIHLRLRQPDNRPIRPITVNGVPHQEFQGDTVLLRQLRKHAIIEVTY